jgi:hypothetical protein
MRVLRHKFGNKIVEHDEKNFHSKAELKRYLALKVLQEKGDVLFFLTQTPFHLPGKTKYVADFMVFWTDGLVTIEDVKGFKTDMYKLKKKQVESLYPITITEIMVK